MSKNEEKVKVGTMTDIYDDLIESDVFDDIKFKKIVERAYEYPPYSREFVDGMNLIPIYSTFSRRKYVACAKRESINKILPSAYITDYSDARGDIVLSETQSYADSDIIIFRKRAEVEYNFLYRQLSVGCLIADDSNAILLKTTSASRIANKITLIQGHVDFSKECYTMSELDYLRHNIERELKEELYFPEGFDPNLKVPVAPSYIINTNRNLTSMEHFGYIYVIKTDCKRIFSEVKTNEPKKHEVIMLSAIDSNLADNLSSLDEWSSLVLHKYIDSL